MYNGLTAYSLNKKSPLPDWYVEIHASGSLIWYQWDVWKNILSTIEYTWLGLDPVTWENFTIFINKKRSKFQFMTFLENQKSADQFHKDMIISQVWAYDNVAFSYGNKLGIIMDNQKKPIQKVSGILENGSFDVVNDSQEVIVQYSWEKTIEWNIQDMDFYTQLSKQWGLNYYSCNDIFENSNVKWKSGTYTINQNWVPVQRECEMTSDGWWDIIKFTKWPARNSCEQWFEDGHFQTCWNIEMDEPSVIPWVLRSQLTSFTNFLIPGEYTVQHDAKIWPTTACTPELSGKQTVLWPEEFRFYHTVTPSVQTFSNNFIISTTWEYEIRFVMSSWEYNQWSCDDNIWFDNMMLKFKTY